HRGRPSRRSQSSQNLFPKSIARPNQNSAFESDWCNQSVPSTCELAQFTSIQCKWTLCCLASIRVVGHSLRSIHFRQVPRFSESDSRSIVLFVITIERR